MDQIKSSRLWRTMQSHTLAFPLLQSVDYPWQALSALSDFILDLGRSLPKDEYEEILPEVWVARTAHIAPTALLQKGCIIGHDTEVRQGAFIRGNVLIGDGVVVGNSTELKGCVLFDGVQVPHFNYVGDSVLGHRAHLGAGAITSNVKSDKGEVIIHCGNLHFPTGRRKLGALLGDCVEVGCNSVLNPGTVIGSGSVIYPLTSVRGCVGENCIYKGEGRIVARFV
jgi:NDP-sugar pyrophosphorylase family protein